MTALKTDRSASSPSSKRTTKAWPRTGAATFIMISVVGGLYGLNLIPLWRPKRITIFDIDPTAITYFRVIHRVFTTSANVEHLWTGSHREITTPRPRPSSSCGRTFA